MNEIEARDFIPNLEEQFTHQELKKAFRSQSFLVHPDMGGSDHEFNLLKEAYEFLQSRAVHTLGENVHEFQTVCGTPLADLGKGLPLTVSARECDICNGLGYKGFSDEMREVKCPDCEGEGVFFLPCKKCGGTGDYKHPRSGKVVGKCNLCGGNGRFYPRHVGKAFGTMGWFSDPFGVGVTLPNGQERRAHKCKRCRGSGTVCVEDVRVLKYLKCLKCEGTGEEQIFNPVLPRGYLTGQRK